MSANPPEHALLRVAILSVEESARAVDGGDFSGIDMLEKGLTLAGDFVGYRDLVGQPRVGAVLGVDPALPVEVAHDLLALPRIGLPLGSWLAGEQPRRRGTFPHPSAPRAASWSNATSERGPSGRDGTRSPSRSTSGYAD
ncbi:hypothetical protein Drose_36280 [Dactylosporangium roseum]|uniref:Uncharacterized protein n=1 Tax=Dactylosporangium roseum TaxID=47989 RepID=A0ABY5Z314_9ACTN|nr:hypothetical protein [Dactylosporangium roseum]UWZ36425.1 hypothetical protein Drose_36280 [Dactylosporangium roseum]